ncbi:MAG: hypothetical protein M0Z78_02575 [Betaproteobacteria bacterium]|jgi:hypothetical protein|nr:hypothetical protein [Betaproteobacteria bacterium]
MNTSIIRIPLLLLAGLATRSAWALDSYRYLHVTVDTPWNIFLFLLIGIFAPFILMAVLAWRYSFKKKSDEGEASVDSSEEHL